MCLQSITQFFCGHRGMQEQQCELAADAPLWFSAACPNYTSRTHNVRASCGVGEFYCSHISNGALLDDLATEFNQLRLRVNEILGQIKESDAEFKEFERQADIALMTLDERRSDAWYISMHNARQALFADLNAVRQNQLQCRERVKEVRDYNTHIRNLTQGLTPRRMPSYYAPPVEVATQLPAELMVASSGKVHPALAPANSGRVPAQDEAHDNSGPQPEWTLGSETRGPAADTEQDAPHEPLTMDLSSPHQNARETSPDRNTQSPRKNRRGSNTSDALEGCSGVRRSERVRNRPVKYYGVTEGSVPSATSSPAKSSAASSGSHSSVYRPGSSASPPKSESHSNGDNGKVVQELKNLDNMGVHPGSSSARPLANMIGDWQRRSGAGVENNKPITQMPSNPYAYAGPPSTSFASMESSQNPYAFAGPPSTSFASMESPQIPQEHRRGDTPRETFVHGPVMEPGRGPSGSQPRINPSSVTASTFGHVDPQVNAHYANIYHQFVQRAHSIEGQNAPATALFNPIPAAHGPGHQHTYQQQADANIDPRLRSGTSYVNPDPRLEPHGVDLAQFGIRPSQAFAVATSIPFALDPRLAYNGPAPPRQPILAAGFPAPPPPYRHGKAASSSTYPHQANGPTASLALAPPSSASLLPDRSPEPKKRRKSPADSAVHLQQKYHPPAKRARAGRARTSDPGSSSLASTAMSTSTATTTGHATGGTGRPTRASAAAAMLLLSALNREHLTAEDEEME